MSQVVYVPHYNPVVVYGTWGRPASPPLAYYPVWPGIVADVGVFGFFPAVGIGVGWWGADWGAWDWAGGGIDIDAGGDSHGGHGYQGGRDLGGHDGRGTRGGLGGTKGGLGGTKGGLGGTKGGGKKK
ncbi:MAG: DUF3300 domain-containing protein [Syntrophobacteraceae bacterium]